jgi:hypothetical protein
MVAWFHMPSVRVARSAMRSVSLRGTNPPAANFFDSVETFAPADSQNTSHFEAPKNLAFSTAAL